MRNEFRNLFIILVVSCMSLPSSSFAAGCGGGASNPLANIPNLAPTKPVPAPEIKPSNVPAATTVAAPAAPVFPLVGKVVWVKGKLSAIDPQKKVRDIGSNAPIYQHDVLETKDDSQAQIVFKDHTMMTLASNTKIYINKYEYKPEIKQGSAGESVMDLIEGGYRTVTGAIAKQNPSDYKVNTEVATIGVRGTDYTVNVKACKLLMKRNKGTPTVQNEKGELALSVNSPYASVEFNKAPLVVKTEPAIFKNPLPIVPATFTTDLPKIGSDKNEINIDKIVPENNPILPSGGGGGKICGPGSVSTGNFTVKIR
jgi:hypothetical protein